MHSLLHLVGAVLVLPYLVLAVLFLLLGQVAQTQGLWALVDQLADQANAVLRWGALALVLAWLGLVAAGFVPGLHKAAALALGLLAVASAGCILALHAGRLNPGHLLFLLPCLAVAGLAAWQFGRAGG